MITGLSILVDLLGQKWHERQQRKKVGKLGVWIAGEVLDAGDEYVAFIEVNGKKDAVMVRSPSKKAAITRRQLIIDTMMGASREEAQQAVQLIARTEGEKTVQIDQ